MKGPITHLRCLLVILFIYIPGKDAFSQWTQSTSLTGGSIVTDIIEFKGDMYINVDGSGVYRSTNDGDSWQKLAVPPQPNFGHFVQHNTELLLFSHSKLYRTSDGNFWNEEDGPAQFINDASSDGVTIFVATSQGLFKSVDSGVTWIKNPDPVTDVSLLSVAVKGSVVVAGLDFIHPGSVLQSANGGSTWTEVVVSTGRVRDLYFQGTDIFANSDYIGIYKSSSNGLSWQPVRPSVFWGKLYVSPSSVYVLSNEKLVFSVNGGTSWVENNNTAPKHSVQEFYVTSDHVFAGCWGGGVVRNNAAGSQPWQSVNTGLVCMDINDIEVVNNTILLGTELSFIRTTDDDGDTWNQLNNSYNSPMSNGRIITSVGTDLYVTDGGGGGIYRSSDNGLTWARKNAGIDNQLVDGLSASGTTIVIGADEGIYISENRGDTWTKRSNGITAGIRTIYCDEKNIYVGTWSGLFHSDNKGESWNKISNGLPDESIGHITSMGSILYAATQFNGLYKTSNGGATWQSLNSDLVFSLASRKNVLFMAAPNNIFSVSLDSGKTWSNIAPGLPTRNITAVDFTTEKIVVGVYKSGAWFRQLTEFLYPSFSFSSAFPDSSFRINESIYIESDQQLQKIDGSVLESSDLINYLTVKNSQGDAVEFEATLDDEKRLITVTVNNAVENETYVVLLDPFKNVSGLSSPAIKGYPFTAILNHVPSLTDDIAVDGPSNETIQFPEALFLNSFSDLDEDDLKKIMIKSLPQHGTLKLGGVPVSINDEIMIESIGNLTYTPDEGFDGVDQWKWNGSDGKAYASRDAIVAIEVTAITGITETTTHNFKLYPNPISEIATIDIPSDLTESGVVHLLDLTGREIKTLNFTNDSHSFDFSDVSKGVYILKVNVEGKHFQQKVIKL